MPIPKTQGFGIPEQQKKKGGLPPFLNLRFESFWYHLGGFQPGNCSNPAADYRRRLVLALSDDP